MLIMGNLLACVNLDPLGKKGTTILTRTGSAPKTYVDSVDPTFYLKTSYFTLFG